VFRLIIYTFPVITTSFDLISDGQTFSNAVAMALSRRVVLYDVGWVQEPHTYKKKEQPSKCLWRQQIAKRQQDTAPPKVM
jgi:hypothetical protein